MTSPFSLTLAGVLANADAWMCIWGWGWGQEVVTFCVFASKTQPVQVFLEDCPQVTRTFFACLAQGSGSTWEFISPSPQVKTTTPRHNNISENTCKIRLKPFFLLFLRNLPERVPCLDFPCHNPPSPALPTLFQFLMKHFLNESLTCQSRSAPGNLNPCPSLAPCD